MDEVNKGGMFMVSQEEAKDLNEKGFGVHHVVNKLDWSKVTKTSGRKIENIIGVRFWTCESDDLSKEEQIKAYNNFLTPTLLVESKKSIHAYWEATDGRLESYRTIQLGLARLFGGDKNLQNPAHTLRSPGFLHWKDPKDPFWVHTIFRSDRKYSERMFISTLDRKLGGDLFKTTKKKQNNKRLPVEHGSFWQKLEAMNQGELLERMSGFQGETIEIKNNQVWVNGRQSRAWIDDQGMLGGEWGPCVYGWIRYFGYSKQQAIEVLKSYFPELGD